MYIKSRTENQPIAMKIIASNPKRLKPLIVARQRRVDAIHLAYHGHILQHRHDLLSAQVHSVLWRMLATDFCIPFNPSCKVKYGTWLSYANDQSVPSGSILPSRALLADGEALEERASRRRPQLRVVHRR